MTDEDLVATSRRSERSSPLRVRPSSGDGPALSESGRFRRIRPSHFIGTFMLRHLLQAQASRPARTGAGSEIVAGERANVVDPVFASSPTARLPRPNAKPCRPLGIVTDPAQHIGMDHAGAAHLDPAGVLADAASLAVAERAVDREVDARLDERERNRSGNEPASLGPNSCRASLCAARL